METAKLSQKYQIVIPQEVRKKMKLQVGSRIAVYSIDNQRAVLLKSPENYVGALKGLGKNIWRALGGATRYIKQERTVWNKKSALTR